MKDIALKVFLLINLFTLFSCVDNTEQNKLITKGISIELAQQRSQNISDVKYDLTFKIPNELEKPIIGFNKVSLNLKSIDHDLIFDFRNLKNSVKKVSCNGTNSAIIVEKEHLVIPKNLLNLGANQISIEFIAGEHALNRNLDYLYTLFVPANASSAFPCFDQPNIKANYLLTLETPQNWSACANYSLDKVEDVDNFKVYSFKETAPISTYLFAFAAGKFQSVTTNINGREMTMYHRETDEKKVKRNFQIVFDLHAKSIDWLEAYTGISYPFEKFDFVLIPAFQFGGMEHPGGILYRQNNLFLDENATMNQKLSRNSLIAHETAHMWFGDLVTMDWFDDVWLKEVFANFMAAKMVNPNFPEINHDYRFLTSHHPSAYSEDRTLGTHAIKQNLENLNQAGLMYGQIIYKKAPVVMNQLEKMIGETKMQEGLKEYLESYSFGNATWENLISILDKKSKLDLKQWSTAWVKEAGMPEYNSILSTEDGEISSYKLRLMNQSSGGNSWIQKTELIVSKNNIINRIPLVIDQNNMSIKELKGKLEPDFILANGSQNGYGYFETDEKSKSFLLKNIHTVEDHIIKFTAWNSLYESMLRGKILPEILMRTIINNLPYENESLGLSARLQYLREVYWGYFTVEEQHQLFPEIGNTIWQLIEETEESSLKINLLDTFISIAKTENDIQKLYQLWSKEYEIDGLNLSVNDFTKLSYELAIREHPKSDNILKTQLDQITNPDRKKAMEFVMPVFSLDESVRDNFFEKLKLKKNRQKEPWVLTSLRYLHHPLRSKNAEKYIQSSLELVEKIQKTNSIFFPKRWISVILNGHRSPEALKILNSFIKTLPKNYSVKLKNKILQAADKLERRAKKN